MGKPEKKPALGPAKISHEPTLSLNSLMAPPATPIAEPPANQLAEILPERLAQSLCWPTLFLDYSVTLSEPITSLDYPLMALLAAPLAESPANKLAEILPKRPIELLCQPALFSD